MAVFIQICENLKKKFLAKMNLLEPSAPLTYQLTQGYIQTV